MPGVVFGRRSNLNRGDAGSASDPDGRRPRRAKEGSTIFKLKRIYDEPSPGDGFRVLVERLWPRGVSKERAALDLWLKDVAPSPGLRKWFGHDPARWEGFQERYVAELKEDDAALDVLRRKGEGGTVTLLFAAHDQEHNSALVLKRFLEHRG
jgi:uncharacterized protein YeaO (DUF488 family)